MKELCRRLLVVLMVCSLAAAILLPIAGCGEKESTPSDEIGSPPGPPPDPAERAADKAPDGPASE